MPSNACVRKSFTKARISYYSNCLISFQVELLRGGDINPNPGPDTDGHGNLHKYDTQSSGAHTTTSTSYTRSELISMERGTQRLPKTVYNTLKLLGLCSKGPTQPGTRGGLKTKSYLNLRRDDRFQSIPELDGYHDMKQNNQNQGNNKLSTIPICILPRIHPYFSGKDNDDRNARSVKARGKSTAICVSHWNACSMNNKTTPICDFILDNGIDIMIVTDSWLRGDARDHHIIADLNMTLPNYSVVHHNRSSRGGGICIIHRSCIAIQNVDHSSFSSF